MGGPVGDVVEALSQDLLLRATDDTFDDAVAALIVWRAGSQREAVRLGEFVHGSADELLRVI